MQQLFNRPNLNQHQQDLYLPITQTNSTNTSDLNDLKMLLTEQDLRRQIQQTQSNLQQLQQV